MTKGDCFHQLSVSYNDMTSALIRVRISVIRENTSMYFLFQHCVKLFLRSKEVNTSNFMLIVGNMILLDSSFRGEVVQWWSESDLDIDDPQG